MGIDEVQLNFSPQTMLLMNVLIGLIMFGVALDLTPKDFTRTLKTPKRAADISNASNVKKRLWNMKICSDSLAVVVCEFRFER